MSRPISRPRVFRIRIIWPRRKILNPRGQLQDERPLRCESPSIAVTEHPMEVVSSRGGQRPKERFKSMVSAGWRTHQPPEPDLGQFLRAHLQIVKAMADVLTCQPPVNIVVRPSLIKEELLRGVERHGHPLTIIRLLSSRQPGGRNASGSSLTRTHCSDVISATNTR